MEKHKITNLHIGKTRPNSTITSVVHATCNTAPTLFITSRDASVHIEVHVCKVGVKQCPVGLEPGDQRGDFGCAQILHSVVPCCLEGFFPLNPAFSVGFNKICSETHNDEDDALNTKKKWEKETNQRNKQSGQEW